MSQELHPVLEGSPVEQSTLYELKLFVHDLLQRMDRLEKAFKALREEDRTFIPPGPSKPSSINPEPFTTPSSNPSNHSSRQQREQYLESIKSPRGGWGAAELAKIGVKWPPPYGWRKHYIKTGKALA